LASLRPADFAVQAQRVQRVSGQLHSIQKRQWWRRLQEPQRRLQEQRRQEPQRQRQERRLARALLP
jgi:hypothetical protein